jgi:hypothetical protein
MRFACPSCETPARATAPAEWQCPSCDHLLRLAAPPVTATPEGQAVQNCAVCGNGELYKMKGFPHWLGLTILAAACTGFLVLHAYYWQWAAWVVLLGSALFDGLLYLWVRDVVVCYRCGAQHRGAPRSGNKPFELTIHERYRQERLRREALGTNPGTAPDQR